ncbi:invasion associated locus B family protein [Lysinibacillus sp. NPDC086135]|uniref:invasion associated locus B family protein n=1 Tax=Lysinibacillus sp. NPDC086135 TaxID=3364130 RepID=UPI00383A0A4A
MTKLLHCSLASRAAFLCSVFAGLTFCAHVVSAQALDTSVKSTRFDDWFLRCTNAKSAAEKLVSQCEVSQVAQVMQGNKATTVLTLAIAKTASDGARKSSQPDLLLTALVPLNVVLPIGLGFSVGDKDVATLEYRNCNEAGCWAQHKLDRKILSQFERSQNADAHLRLMNGENLNIRFSLKGLSKALAELQKPAKA